MKKSEVFRKAAERVTVLASGEGMCLAVAQVSVEGALARPRIAVVHRMLAGLYRTDARRAGPHYAWWGDNWGYSRRTGITDMAEADECRVLGLLFAAEVAESEGD